MKNLQVWQRSLVVWGSVVLIIASLYWARAILILVVLAVLFTFILSPLVTQVQRAGLGRIPASLLVVALACLIVGALSFVVLVQVGSLALEIPNHKEVILQKIESIHQAGKGSWLDKVYTAFTEIADRFNQNQTPAPGQKGEPVPVQVQSSNHWALVRATVGPTLEFLVNVGLVIILVAFMLIGREDLRDKLNALLPALAAPDKMKRSERTAEARSKR
jgi:predicted PurR-regulated permease PerM